MKIRIVFIITFLFFIQIQAFLHAEIVFIPEREYFEVVHKELLNAWELRYIIGILQKEKE